MKIYCVYYIDTDYNVCRYYFCTESDVFSFISNPFMFNDNGFLNIWRILEYNDNSIIDVTDKFVK